MRELNEREYRSLLALLADAEQLVREQAVEHAYRRKAMTAVRERLVAQYHGSQAHHALDVAAALHQARAGLEERRQKPRRAAA